MGPRTLHRRTPDSVVIMACLILADLGTTAASDVAPWVKVSSVVGLTAALRNRSIERVVLATGTYTFDATSRMTDGSALLVTDNNITVAAEQPGAVLLDANRTSRVFEIAYGAVVELIGLNITGGYSDEVRPHRDSLGTPFGSSVENLYALSLTECCSSLAGWWGARRGPLLGVACS